MEKCYDIYIDILRMELIELCVKMISSESIIGNFLLAALEKGDDRINVDKLFMFESLLGSNLNHLNYFTCLNYMNILDFAEDYPFFCKVCERNQCMYD